MSNNEMKCYSNAGLVHSRISCLFRHILLFSLVLLGVRGWTNAETLEEADTDFFQGTFEEALEHAKDEGKLVLLEGAYGKRSWCGICIAMQETVFSSAEVKEFLNSRFVIYPVFVRENRWQDSEIAAKYKITRYPTYIVIDSDGKELSRVYLNSVITNEQFIDLVGQMIGESQSDFDTLQNRYDQGNRSPDFIQEYLKAAVVHYILGNKQSFSGDHELLSQHLDERRQFRSIAAGYFNSRPFDELLNPTDIYLVLHFKNRVKPGDKLFEYVMNNFDSVLEHISISAISQFVLNAMSIKFRDLAVNGDDRYLTYSETLNNSFPQVTNYVQLRAARFSNPILSEQSYLDWTYLRANAKRSSEGTFVLRQVDYETLYKHYSKRLSDTSATITAAEFSHVAGLFGTSSSLGHKKFALGSARKATQLEPKEPWYSHRVVDLLGETGQQDEALKTVRDYVSSLSDSDEDLKLLESFLQLLGATN
ncbi:MAG: thioredoxin family protein [Gammaproteobacteria bacterium]|nr:thioredoxin family protein [Gammaproteobacteria bacterium]